MQFVAGVVKDPDFFCVYCCDPRDSNGYSLYFFPLNFPAFGAIFDELVFLKQDEIHRCTQESFFFEGKQSEASTLEVNLESFGFTLIV
jgi:hypothetical protein